MICVPKNSSKLNCKSVYFKTTFTKQTFTNSVHDQNEMLLVRSLIIKFRTSI